MKQPCEDNPLAVLDCSSVDRLDVVPTAVCGFTPTGRPILTQGLKHSAKHRWCYYPKMTVDEVLVFTQFVRFKNDGDSPPVRTAFHCAFKDPNTPPLAEKRQSCECRTGVWFGSK